MRIGQNPSKIKGSPAYTPARVGIASLTYVPALEGYFREALEVIRVHLASIRHSLDQDCDLLVFDNGSCAEVIDFLQEQWRLGLIDWLCLSHHNLGKNGALNWIFAAMPNEFIAYSDSDVFYRKGWLEESLRIFDSFERAGMVSAQPVFFDFLRGQGKTALEIAAAGQGLQIQSIKPRQEILDEYCEGINASPALRAQFQQQRLQVAINTNRGVRAVTSATDMQFMLRKELTSRLLPFPIAGALTAKDAIDIPRGIEDLGYWLLSTEEPLVWHMGNSILGREIAEIERLVSADAGVRQAVQSRDGARPERSGLKQSLKASLRALVRRSPALKRATERAYGGLFSVLYEEE
jgi:hypothetical protein